MTQTRIPKSQLDITLVTTTDSHTVTNTMLDFVVGSSIKGNPTGGNSPVIDMSGTQATTLLDTFTTTLKGLVPPPATSSGRFLSDAGTWVAGNSYTASTGLTLTGSAFSVNTSQNITTLSNFTSAGSVQTSAAGLLSSVANTGTGNNVLATSPTLVTPVLGVATATSINKVTITAPTTSATLTLAQGSTLATSGAFSITLTATAATNVTFPTSGTVYGTATGSITSAQLAASLTDETGTGANVFATSPTLVTPALGTPSAVVLTNATGLPLTTGVTGALPEVNGGTNQTTYTAGDMLYSSATNTLAKLPIGATVGMVIKSTGTAPVWALPAGPRVVQTITITAGTAQIIVNNLKAGYNYEIEFQGVYGSSVADLGIQTSTDNGATFTTTSVYTVSQLTASASTAAAFGSAAYAFMPITASGYGTTAATGASGTYKILDPNNATYITRMFGQMICNNTSLVSASITSSRGVAEANNAFKIVPSGGTMTAGLVIIKEVGP